LPAWGDLQHNWLVFANWGQAEAAKSIAATDQMRSISDVGIGWSGNYKNALVRVHLAHRLDKAEPVSEPFSRNKLLVQAGWVF